MREESLKAMFEKPLTPSDVSKLNRLVIPKQYADRYFPSCMASTARGMMLRFEDEEGKEWIFRYSYWTSSQSYVLTKGWSKYVKEKRLQASDVVSFFRGHRLHIRWRRPVVASPVSPSTTRYPPPRNDVSGTPSHSHSPGGQQVVLESSPAVNTTRPVRLFGVNLILD